MTFPIIELGSDEFPPLLQEIPQPPKQLNYRGMLPSPDMKLLAVVGSRKYSDYGKQVVEHLISGLQGYNIGIVSGLALGIDSLAHKAALRANMYTLSIPGSGLDDSVMYPATHRGLARTILESGGGLLSEFEPTFKATSWSFPQRNRLVCGIAHATLIVEATAQSGTLITARMCVDYNRDLLAVPGSIFSSNTIGTHQFLKLGATLVTDATDILHALHIDPLSVGHEASPHVQLTATETQVLQLLSEPATRDDLICALNLPTHEVSALLMAMEMKNIITTQGIHYRRQ